MDKKIPTSAEIQKDVNDFLSKKYGGNVFVADPDEAVPKDGVHTTQKDSKLNFDIKPIELEEYLNNYVVGQHSAVEILATKIATHYNRMKFEKENNVPPIMGNIKSNVLMIGPTGVGKTFIIKLIAEKIGVPFVKGDATKFSETGYVGGDVEDLVRDLVREADGDMSIAEYGIIYLDEIDKIAGSKNLAGGIDVSRTGVQRNLLKIMEESEVDLRVPHDIASQMEAALEAQKTGKVEKKKINTKNILFVVSGAFSGLEDVIKRRLKKQIVGFKSDIESDKYKTREDYFQQTVSEDLIEFGFESEFIGRLPILAVLKELKEYDLFQILQNKNSSVILGKKRDFQAYGIKIEFTEEAYKIISKRGINEKTGARGLISVIEKALMKYEKILPSSNVKKLLINEKVINNPEEQLDLMILRADIDRFVKEFFETHGITLYFNDEATKKLLEIFAKENRPVFDILKEKLYNYEYGLKLIGAKEFEITSEVIESSKEYLDKLIKVNYEKSHKNT